MGNSQTNTPVNRVRAAAGEQQKHLSISFAKRRSQTNSKVSGASKRSRSRSKEKKGDKEGEEDGKGKRGKLASKQVHEKQTSLAHCKTAAQNNQGAQHSAAAAAAATTTTTTSRWAGKQSRDTKRDISSAKTTTKLGPDFFGPDVLAAGALPALVKLLGAGSSSGSVKPSLSSRTHNNAAALEPTLASCNAASGSSAEIRALNSASSSGSGCGRCSNSSANKPTAHRLDNSIKPTSAGRSCSPKLDSRTRLQTLRREPGDESRGLTTTGSRAPSGSSFSASEQTGNLIKGALSEAGAKTGADILTTTKTTGAVKTLVMADGRAGGPIVVARSRPRPPVGLNRSMSTACATGTGPMFAGNRTQMLAQMTLGALESATSASNTLQRFNLGPEEKRLAVSRWLATQPFGQHAHPKTWTRSELEILGNTTSEAEQEEQATHSTDVTGKAEQSSIAVSGHEIISKLSAEGEPLSSSPELTQRKQTIYVLRPDNNVSDNNNEQHQQEVSGSRIVKRLAPSSFSDVRRLAAVVVSDFSNLSGSSMGSEIVDSGSSSLLATDQPDEKLLAGGSNKDDNNNSSNSNNDNNNNSGPNNTTVQKVVKLSSGEFETRALEKHEAEAEALASGEHEIGAQNSSENWRLREKGHEIGALELERKSRHDVDGDNSNTEEKMRERDIKGSRGQLASEFKASSSCSLCHYLISIQMLANTNNKRQPQSDDSERNFDKATVQSRGDKDGAQIRSGERRRRREIDALECSEDKPNDKARAGPTRKSCKHRPQTPATAPNSKVSSASNAKALTAAAAADQDGECDLSSTESSEVDVAHERPTRQTSSRWEELELDAEAEEGKLFQFEFQADGDMIGRMSANGVHLDKTVCEISNADANLQDRLELGRRANARRPSSANSKLCRGSSLDLKEREQIGTNKKPNIRNEVKIGQQEFQQFEIDRQKLIAGQRRPKVIRGLSLDRNKQQQLKQSKGLFKQMSTSKSCNMASRRVPSSSKLIVINSNNAFYTIQVSSQVVQPPNRQLSTGGTSTVQQQRAQSRPKDGQVKETTNGSEEHIELNPKATAADGQSDEIRAPSSSSLDHIDSGKKFLVKKISSSNPRAFAKQKKKTGRLELRQAPSTATLAAPVSQLKSTSPLNCAPNCESASIEQRSSVANCKRPERVGGVGLSGRIASTLRSATQPELAALKNRPIAEQTAIRYESGRMVDMRERATVDNSTAASAGTSEQVHTVRAENTTIGTEIDSTELTSTQDCVASATAGDELQGEIDLISSATSTAAPSMDSTGSGSGSGSRMKPALTGRGPNSGATGSSDNESSNSHQAHHVNRSSSLMTDTIRASWQASDAGETFGLSPLPGVLADDEAAKCNKAAKRLRELAAHLEHGSVPQTVLYQTLEYAASVLDSVTMDQIRVSEEEDGDLSEVQSDAVPNEVRKWLETTFTRNSISQKRKSEDKLKFRSVANAIRAGIVVDRIYRRMSASTPFVSAQVSTLLKSIDDWSFDCFAVNQASSGQVLKSVGYELFNRYGLMYKFKIPTTILKNFLTQIESGYVKNKNPYHNNLHAADVTQTVHYMLWQAGLTSWLTDLEIFATLLAAIIHDYLHTGTTNSFHVMSQSDTALMYNDRAVLENFHICQAFTLMRNEDCNILASLSRDEYREFRSLVIDMVLATDMSSHFQQIKAMKNILNHADSFSADKSKILSLVIHISDISHPAKEWELHSNWTQLLMEEFFRQGDREKELDLECSPLCDRETTLVAESQLGFIEFIVSPSLEVCGDVLDRVHYQMAEANAKPVLPASAKAASIVAASSSANKQQQQQQQQQQTTCSTAAVSETSAISGTNEDQHLEALNEPPSTSQSDRGPRRELLACTKSGALSSKVQPAASGSSSSSSSIAASFISSETLTSNLRKMIVSSSATIGRKLNISSSSSSSSTTSSSSAPAPAPALAANTSATQTATKLGNKAPPHTPTAKFEPTSNAYSNLQSVTQQIAVSNISTAASNSNQADFEARQASYQHPVIRYDSAPRPKSSDPRVRQASDESNSKREDNGQALAETGSADGALGAARNLASAKGRDENSAMAVKQSASGQSAGGNNNQSNRLAQPVAGDLALRRNTSSGLSSCGTSSQTSRSAPQLQHLKIHRPWIACLERNKKMWHERAITDAQARELKEKMKQQQIESGSESQKE